MSPPHPSSSSGAAQLRLQEEATLARRRFQRYLARTYGPAVTSAVILSQLERAYLLAETRLQRTNPAARPGGGAPGSAVGA